MGGINESSYVCRSGPTDRQGRPWVCAWSIQIRKVWGAVKKFPEFSDIDGLMHHEFVAPGQSASSAEEAATHVAGRDRGFCITIRHRATYRLLYHHPATVRPGSRSEGLLALPYSENRPQGETFRSHGGQQIECDDRTPQHSKRTNPPVLPTMIGWMQQVLYMRKGPTVKVIR
jgi:hypothetical protein